MLPYLTPGYGITTVRAGSFDGPVLRTTDGPEFSFKENVGNWDNGVVRDARPYQLVYLSGNRWMRLSLRDSTSSPVDTGVREPEAVCLIYALRTDYADPSRGIMTYFTAGEDLECDTEDDRAKGFRLDKTDAPTLLSTGRPPRISPRVFRNPDSGALTGILVVDGSNLRLYSADLSSSKVIITRTDAAPLRIGTGFGFSSARIWATIDDGTQKALCEIRSDGTINHLFPYGPGESLTNGFLGAHSNQLYFTLNRGDGSSEIMRLRLSDGSAESLYRSSSRISQIMAVTDDGLLYEHANPDGAGGAVSMLRFKTGNSELVDSWGNGYVQQYATTNDGRIQFTSHHSAIDGKPVLTAYLVSPKDPALNKIWQNSEWLGVIDEDINLNNPDIEPATHGFLVREFTGDYRTSGHGGGRLVRYHYATDSQLEGPEIPSGTIVGGLGGSVSSPIGLTTVTTLGSDPGQDSIDIFGFNLRDFLSVQVTATPADNEQLLFP